MNVLVTCEQHFERTPDGSVWTDGQFPYPFWTRYLSAFDSVHVFARVRNSTSQSPNRQRSDGEKVSFFEVPDYLGPEQYLLQAARIAAEAKKAIRVADAMILRVSGRMGCCIQDALRRVGRPYAVEVVSDPYDAFAPGALRHPLRPLFRWTTTKRLKAQCAGACAAAYVTEHALQRRYPPGPSAYAAYYSDVELPKNAFVKVPRIQGRPKLARVLFVGTLAQYYKAPDVLIDAVADCLRNGLELELVIVGAGKYQDELEHRAAQAGLGRNVQFRGQLSNSQAVRDEMDRADLFILPSRQEGLPRAMIEAMARAMPCIGSTIGGIPELLAPEDLVKPDDVAGLARKIREVFADSSRMARMSARNLRKAGDYRPEDLRLRREDFYQKVRSATEAWQGAHRISSGC